jgi:hypothetical protein
MGTRASPPWEARTAGTFAKKEEGYKGESVGVHCRQKVNIRRILKRTLVLMMTMYNAFETFECFGPKWKSAKRLTSLYLNVISGKLHPHDYEVRSAFVKTSACSSRSASNSRSCLAWMVISKIRRWSAGEGNLTTAARMSLKVYAAAAGPNQQIIRWSEGFLHNWKSFPCGFEKCGCTRLGLPRA